MHIHILGICGTFMAGIALLARELGHEVSGSDANAYPPMSEQLAAQGITVMSGYDPTHLEPVPECVVVGNALTRGNPAVGEMLNRGMRYQSGPSWLATHVLQERWVLAVAGTHGKTSTSCMLAWILETAGHAPGFLVGGVIFVICALAGFFSFFFGGAGTGAAAGPAAGALPGMDTRLTLTTLDANRLPDPDWGMKIRVPRKTR